MSKNKEIKKHSSAIRATGRMSLLERKLSNVLWANAQDELLTETVHSINLSLLCEIVGYNSNDTTKIKKAFKNLRHISIEWDYFNEDGENEWGDVPWLIPTIKGSKFHYQYPEELKKVLIKPEVYGIINMQMQRQFVSGYALTIYETCSQFKGLVKKNGVAYTEWFTLDEFKRILGIQNNVSYEQFKEFNRTILKPSMHEINGTLKKYAGTDIFIEPEYKKMNRAISDIRFKIKLNPQTQIPLEKDENEELRKLPLYEKLCERGFSDKGALHVLISNDAEYIEEKILIVDEAEEQGKIKSSVSGYLKRAIDDDYQPLKSKSKAKQESDNEALKAEQKAKEEEAKAERDSKRKKDITLEMREQYIATISESEQAELFEKLKSDSPAIMKKMVKDLTHPSFADAINKLIPDFENELSKRLAEDS